MHGHVLNDTDNRHPDLFKHLKALAGVEQRNVLRCGDNHGAGHGYFLRKRQLDITRARRQVDDQIVKIIPTRLVEQLFQCLRDHRTAPNHRRFRINQKPHTHRLDAVAFHGLHGLTVLGLRPTGDAEHGRLGGAVDVSVEHADHRAFGRQRQRKIHRSG